MSQVFHAAGRRAGFAMNGRLNEASALVAVGDHLQRIAGWQRRIGHLRHDNSAHREQMEALRVAVRISRSELQDIVAALSPDAAKAVRVSEALGGYDALAERLRPVAAAA